MRCSELAHYHSDGSPEQELSADNPAAVIRVIGLAELAVSEAGLTLSDRRHDDGSLQTLAETLAQDPSALHALLGGEQAPVKIDWHDDAVIVTVAVVRPKAQDHEYITHTGQLMADLRLAGSRAETQYVEHAYLSDPGEQWAQTCANARSAPDGAFAGGQRGSSYRLFDVDGHDSEHRVVEGQRVLVWLRMDEIDAYQAPDGLIELSPYLHVDQDRKFDL